MNTATSHFGNVVNVTTMVDMSSNAPSFNSDLSSRNVANVAVELMLVGASASNSDLSLWNVARVTQM